jgi:hypothetical protein
MLGDQHPHSAFLVEEGQSRPAASYVQSGANPPLFIVQLESRLIAGRG